MERRFADEYTARRIVEYDPHSPNFQRGVLVFERLQRLVANKRLDLVPHSVQEDEQGMGGSARFREPKTGVYLEYEFAVDTEVVDAVMPSTNGEQVIGVCARALGDELGRFYTQQFK